MGLVDCEMIAQFIVMQFKELLPGYPIVGGDAKAIFEEKKAFVQVEKRVAFWVLDHRREEAVIGVGFADVAKDLRVELNEGNSVYFILRLLNIRVPGKGVSGGVGDARDVSDLRIESRESLVPADLTRGQFLLGLPVR